MWALHNQESNVKTAVERLALLYCLYIPWPSTACHSVAMHHTAPKIGRWACSATFLPVQMPIAQPNLLSVSHIVHKPRLSHQV